MRAAWPSDDCQCFVTFIGWNVEKYKLKIAYLPDDFIFPVIFFDRIPHTNFYYSISAKIEPCFTTRGPHIRWSVTELTIFLFSSFFTKSFDDNLILVKLYKCTILFLLLLDLWQVCEATTVSYLTYASPAWWGYADANSRQRLQSVLNKLKKHGFLPHEFPSHEELCEQMCRGAIQSGLEQQIPRFTSAAPPRERNAIFSPT